jgi:hypothetical protein
MQQQKNTMATKMTYLINFLSICNNANNSKSQNGKFKKEVKSANKYY